MSEGIKKAERIQTSILNGLEKKCLAWLAERQPRWVVSDTLTFIGIAGALMTGLGYMLSDKCYCWRWLAVAGFIVNWYGDSLDGTLARVRKTQRPIYGYYIDHTVDCVNEALIFGGLGLSSLMRLDLAMMIFAVYLCLTLNVSINAHLKSEFKLTYAKLGPTEFRLIAMIVTMLFIFIKPLRDFTTSFHMLGRDVQFHALDLFGIVVLAVLLIIYAVTVFNDAAGYSKADPMPKRKD